MYKSAVLRPCLIPLILSVRSAQHASTNFYDVLNVPKDCTEKEIRDSFVKLSKLHHPDTSQSKDSAAAFQAIMEAYKVLGKSDTRRTYDSDQQVRHVYPVKGFATAADFAQQRQSSGSGGDPTNNYYGIDGVQKMSNRLIFWSILGVAAVGVVLQAIAIKCSFTFKRDQLDQASLRAHRIHTAIRQEVDTTERDVQLERVLKNMQKNM